MTQYKTDIIQVERKTPVSITCDHCGEIIGKGFAGAGGRLFYQVEIEDNSLGNDSIDFIENLDYCTLVCMLKGVEEHYEYQRCDITCDIRVRYAE